MSDAFGELDLEGTDDDLSPVQGADAAESSDEKQPPLQFPTVGEWVRVQLVSMYSRKLGDQHACWCSEWWKHGEAVNRLTALWQGWEQARLQPAGLLSWWTLYFDAQMHELMSQNGPFRYCRNGEHDSRIATETLPVKLPPWGLFNPPSA